MTKISTTTERVAELLDELRAGRLEARGELFAVARNRLLAICRRLKEPVAAVDRWEQTVDVVDDAAEELFVELAATQIKDAAHFYRLAAVAIRRRIDELAQHYAQSDVPPTRPGRNPPAPASDPRANRARIEDTFDPARAARWAQISEAIDRLPAEERDATEMLWFYEMPFADAANLLGVEEKTLRRRWRRARMQLHRALDSAIG